MILCNDMQRMVFISTKTNNRSLDRIQQMLRSNHPQASREQKRLSPFDTIFEMGLQIIRKHAENIRPH